MLGIFLLFNWKECLGDRRGAREAREAGEAGEGREERGSEFFFSPLTQEQPA